MEHGLPAASPVHTLITAAPAALLYLQHRVASPKSGQTLTRQSP